MHKDFCALQYRRYMRVAAMLWIALATVAVVGVILREVSLAPEVSDDYEIELWEKYRRERQDDAPPPAEKPARHLDAA